jgi:hypothetical protein
MVKAVHRGLAKPGDPFYKQGWSSYIGPRQNEPLEKPPNTKPSESADPSVVEPSAEAEETEE